MSKRHLMIAIVTLPLAAVEVAAQDRAGNIEALAALCKSNPDCTRLDGATADLISFRIQDGSAVFWVFCTVEAKCVRIYAMGRHAAIQDMPALLTPK